MSTVLRRCFVITLIGFLTSQVDGQVFFADGQRPKFNLITRQSGLPSSSVSSIQQDRRGFLWLGTQGGLSRYDGRRFRTHRNQPFNLDSLPHDLVQTIYYDEETDSIWVGTYDGLARFTAGRLGFETYRHDYEDPTSLSNAVVLSISRGPEGRLWVGTQDGLNRMTDGGAFERIPTSSEVIRDLLLDSDGVLWIATYDGLARWDGESERVVDVDIELPSPFVMALDEIEPGTILIGTWGTPPYPGGIAVYSVDRGVREVRQFSANTIYTVLAADDGSLWAGSWGGGLFAVTSDGEVYEFTLQSADSLASSVIYALFQDATGLIWVGTNGGGLHYLSPRQRNYRTHFHDPERPGSLPAGKINALIRTRDGTLWAGLYSGGLARYDDDGAVWYRYRHDATDRYSLADDIVTTLFEDRDGYLWVGTNEGLQRYDAGSDRFHAWGRDVHEAAVYDDEIIYALEQDRRGRFWIGTYRQGVRRFDPVTGETRVYRHDASTPGTLTDDLIYDILADGAGDIWIATNDGLNRYREESDDFEAYRYDPRNPRGLSSNSVRVLYEDSRGWFWIGTTSGGLSRLDRRSRIFEHLTEEDGLSNNTILAILEGYDGRVWASTQRGLSMYDPATDHIDVLDERDGLFGSEFHTGHFRDPDGTLLFGGGHGITQIDSSVTTQNPHPPRVQITDVRVFQESIDSELISFNGASLRLGPDDSFVSFEFVALDYESPESNTYAYRLVGFDREWIYSGTRNFATYTNLPAGHYQLQVQAANAAGSWSETPVLLDLTVLRPWYLHWWALTIYGLVGVLVFRGAWRIREARVLSEKNQALKHAVSQLAVANKELERLSVRDPLTGVFNRRYFDAHLAEEWSRARRSHCSIALIMIDVDRFKQFNDIYGHVAGDRALSAVSAVMESQLSRTTDFLARYGGEEFAVLLYETDQDGARHIGERIRRAVEETDTGEGLRPVTVSLGVSVAVPQAGVTASNLVQSADEALYTAKRNGRNRLEYNVCIGA